MVNTEGKNMKEYNELATSDVITKTVEALKQNGIEAYVAENSQEAKQKFYELVPKGSEVMIMTSETLRGLNLEDEINKSSDYVTVKQKIAGMPEDKAREKKQMGAAPQVATGSVHAITEKGEVIVASNTGSQLPAYVYGADSVVWVVGAQKLVTDMQEGLKRIYEYVLPLETVRARKAYGLPETWNSNPSKILFINREVTAGRIKIIIVKEVLGF
jgi:L-lactate utilization protein LutB